MLLKRPDSGSLPVQAFPAVRCKNLPGWKLVMTVAHFVVMADSKPIGRPQILKVCDSSERTPSPVILILGAFF